MSVAVGYCPMRFSSLVSKPFATPAIITVLWSERGGSINQKFNLKVTMRVC